MSKKTIGCIGCGSMGGALLCGLARQQQHTLLGYNRSPAPLEALKAVGVIAEPDALTLVKKSSIIILAVKPHQIQGVIEAIRPNLTPDKILISVAAAIKVSELIEMAKGACPIVRVMPNTTAMAGAGIFGICYDDPLLSDANKKAITELFEEMGQSIVLPEHKINQFTAVFACGPGYIYLIMEAIREAAVTLGFSWAEAAELTATMVYGAGKLAAESGQHFAILREQVCSPAGITVNAINQLERSAVRASIIDAILVAAERADEMEE